MDYDFLTETTTGNGLNWSVDIIDTAEDASKIWRVSTYKFQYLSSSGLVQVIFRSIPSLIQLQSI